MSKKIEDYLPLYIGSECIIGDLNWKSQNIAPEDIAPYTDPEFGKPIRSTVTLHSIQAFSHKLHIILRPLSSMTEEECVNVYTIERDRMLHSPTDDHDIRRGDGCWKIVRLDFIDTTLFITDEAVVYKVTEDNGKPLIEYIKNLPEIFTYLLSRHFDLFNLIPENLAIDSTTIKTP